MGTMTETCFERSPPSPGPFPTSPEGCDSGPESLQSQNPPSSPLPLQTCQHLEEEEEEASNTHACPPQSKSPEYPCARRHRGFSIACLLQDEEAELNVRQTTDDVEQVTSTSEDPLPPSPPQEEQQTHHPFSAGLVNPGTSALARAAVPVTVGTAQMMALPCPPLSPLVYSQLMGSGPLFGIPGQ